jgi:hypothetical protein
MPAVPSTGGAVPASEYTTLIERAAFDKEFDDVKFQHLLEMKYTDEMRIAERCLQRRAGAGAG